MAADRGPITASSLQRAFEDLTWEFENLEPELAGSLVWRDDYVSELDTEPKGVAKVLRDIAATRDA